MQEKLLEKILTYLSNTETFLVEQAPDFIREYLTWCFWLDVLWIVIWAIVIAVIIIVGVCIYKNSYKTIIARYGLDSDYGKRQLNEIKTNLSLFIGVMLLVLLAAVSINAYDIIKIKIAPKVYLIDTVLGIKRR